MAVFVLTPGMAESPALMAFKNRPSKGMDFKAPRRLCVEKNEMKSFFYVSPTSLELVFEIFNLQFIISVSPGYNFKTDFVINHQ